MERWFETASVCVAVMARASQCHSVGVHGMCRHQHASVMKHAHLPTVCLRCLRKLRVLRIMGENKNTFPEQLGDGKLRASSEDTLCSADNDTGQAMKMQHEERKPKTMWILQNMENPETSSKAGPSHPQEVNVCKCEKCALSQYGGLPLLADVVEKSSRLDSQGTVGPSSVTTNEPYDQSKVTSGAHVVPNEHIKTESAIVGHSRSLKKEISCEFCGKSFNHTGDLNKHRRSHTGERPYACKECDKRFSHASNLLRHRKIHSGERPFTCPACGKGFSRKDKMVSHIKTAICARRSDSHTMTSPQHQRSPPPDLQLPSPSSGIS